MRRRNTDASLEEPSCNRRKLPIRYTAVPEIDIKSGEVLTDLTGKRWRLGRTVGTGGFGEIFLASDDVTNEVSPDSQYVAKVETHTNGPLFVEINCYLRIGRKDCIDKWKKENKLENLGMPYYVASGSHVIKDSKYRFLIIPRFEKDLEQIFESKHHKFNLKTVLTIALQLLDTLEYIHSKGYVHSDIKASNILLENTHKETKLKSPVRSTAIRHYGIGPLRTCRVKKIKVSQCLRPNVSLRYLEDFFPTNQVVKRRSADQVYLLDFGLASKYLQSTGEHRELCTDERKAHAGTIIFCSLDAHKGAQSRRSDLESLGYNIIYWLTSSLPWMDDTEEPHLVHKKKQKCLANLYEFLMHCFENQHPKFLYDYFKYLVELDFKTEPDYAYCRNLFVNALKDYGYKNNAQFDFDNREGWGSKQKKLKRNSENKRRLKQVSYKLNRIPLMSNLPIKVPELRKKRKNKKIGKLNWSKILIDPEIILKQKKSRDRKLTETSEPGSGVLNLDIDHLNPTYAMLEIYNKSIERANSGCSPKYNGDGLNSIEGYTSAMMVIYNRKKEREEMELEKMVVSNSKSSNRSNRSGVVSRKRPVNKKKPSSSKPRLSRSVQEIKKESPKRVKGVTSTRSYRLRG